MKRIIKLTETDLVRIVKKIINEQKSIDTILDKINQVGIENLTKFEKYILKNSNENSNINDEVIKWLDKNYSELNIIEEERLSFGRPKEFILFLDDDMEMIFEYDKSNKTLYASYEDIIKNLRGYLDDELLIRWFQKTYKIYIKNISSFFKNIE